MSDSLINKYRPKTFDEVVGHEAQVRALKNALAKKLSRQFLFTGGSGYGKTTLARIVATEAGCKPQDLIEIDAATHTGIDDVRAVTKDLFRYPVGDSDVKAIIVDEMHALSKAAAQALLKILEEPPEWVYWFLCTTEPTRVLPTLRTRCFKVDLKPVPFGKLAELLDQVAEKEKIKQGPEVIDICASAADGSPRQALANLALCADVKSAKEAERLLASAEESAEAFQLAQLLQKRAKWAEIQKLLVKLEETEPETIRRVVCSYMRKVANTSANEPAAGRAIEILDAFDSPFAWGTHDRYKVSLACGKAVLS